MGYYEWLHKNTGIGEKDVAGKILFWGEKNCVWQTHGLERKKKRKWLAVLANMWISDWLCTTQDWGVVRELEIIWVKWMSSWGSTSTG